MNIAGCPLVARRLFRQCLGTIHRPLATLSQAKSETTFLIPVVDFKKFRNAVNESEKKATAQEIVTAFKEVGFVYLRNYGISDNVVQNAFSKSKNFFAMTPDKKEKLAWDDPRSNRGYVQQGRERVTQSTDASEIALLRSKAPDAKESMEIGRDWDPAWKNKWPQEQDSPGFRTTMLDFFQSCHELHVSVMGSIALGLGLKEKFFEELINQQYHNLRLLHYPPVKASILRQEGQARAGAHSDYGSLTFVFQDQVGGLEVQNPDSGRFHPATPILGTVVVNVGDLLARWSNDVLRSTLHRVVAPSTPLTDGDAMTPPRQSIAFFCNPNPGAQIVALPTCVTQDRPQKYDPVETQQYIVRRLSDTYT